MLGGVPGDPTISFASWSLALVVSWQTPLEHAVANRSHT